MDSIKRIREDSNLKLRIRVRSGPRIRANSGRIRIRANSCEFEPASLDYTVEKILAQRSKASAPGGLEFKVRWRGYGPSHDTWEPVSSFVPRVNTPFMEYIRKHKTKIHVSDLAALTRAIAARGA